MTVGYVKGPGANIGNNIVSLHGMYIQTRLPITLTFIYSQLFTTQGNGVYNTYNYISKDWLYLVGCERSFYHTITDFV